MRFDSSAAVQNQIRYTLGRNPHMIRFSVVKLGDKLGTKNGAIEDVAGQVEWRTKGHNASLENFLGSQMQRGAKPMEFV